MIRRAVGVGASHVITRQSAGGLLMFQCVFGTASTRSVSVAVAATTTQRGAALTPREYWRRQFHGAARDARDEREGEGEGEREYAARYSRYRRRSLLDGESHRWRALRARGDTFVRLSVGGIPDERERIEKSKARARAAIRKL